MRKLLAICTSFCLAGVLLASCGGGGGGSSSISSPAGPGGGSGSSPSNSGGSGSSTPTRSGLTVVPESTRAVSPSYLFESGLKPKLICDEGVVEPDEVSRTELHFPGDSFTNCTLTFTSPSGTVVYTGLNSITASSGAEVKLKSDLTLSVVSGNATLSPLTDSDSDGVADSFENKTVTDTGVENATLYDKTVIVVMVGDDLGDSSLTEELKANYNQLVNGIQTANPEKTKFVVIWDGDQADGLDGDSDVFILDPDSGKTFSVLDQDIQNILSGDSVGNYNSDGILFWYGASDNLSNHLKKLIEVAVRMFPARSYDLIISDHGDGWVSLPTPTTRTVLFEHFSDGQSAGTTWLGTKQFVDTVLKPLSDEGIKFDLLAFDECLMGEFATLTLLQPYANVFVASPEYEEADGWGNVWGELPSWYETENSTWEIAKKIVDGYAEYYKTHEPQCQLCYGHTIALTAVKSEAIETLRQSFEQFAESLYKTALNERENGQMREVFGYYFENNATVLMDRAIYWGDSNIGENAETDSIASKLSILNYSGHSLYGYDGNNFLGYDLIYAVKSIGLTARAIELGYQTTGYYKIGEDQNLNPSFDPLTDDRAVDFVETYNSVVANDQLYTKYLSIDYDPDTVPEERQGSGLGLIYPYTSPDFAQSPKLELCNYENFVESYNETLPNYTGFVKTVFEEMWKAVKDSGLDREFTCDTGSGNLVWNTNQ